MNWNKFQQQAIYGSGGTILVSAGAGSGKTAVLVERIIQKIVNPKNNINIDELLIVTFSNAAAEEIKERISSKINSLLIADPFNEHLQKQQILLDSANISTIHSFCQSIIKENFETLTISADFKICNEYQANLIKHQAFLDVIDEFYNYPAFDNILKTTDTIYNSDKLFSIIKNIFDFLQSLPFPNEWMKQTLESYQHYLKTNSSNEYQVNFITIIYKYGLELAQKAKVLILECLDLSSNLENYSNYETNFNEKLILIDDLISFIKNSQWSSAYSFLKDYKASALPHAKKNTDPIIKENIKNRHDQFKEIIKNLKTNYFCCSTDELKLDIKYTYEFVDLLFEIINRFGQKYAELKHSKNFVDFSDLEQLASILLLVNNNGSITPSQIAKNISKNFKEIFIDEYQDTNLIQEYIFRAISNNETNLFMVGDAKQSIYRFRQAMPELFITKNKYYTNFDNTNFPAKIYLTQNFRSQPEVTSFINFVFNQLMSEEIGEINYDESQFLIPTKQKSSNDHSLTEIHFLTNTNIVSSEEKLYNEAKYIALKIKEMVENKITINKDDKLTNVQYSDFCILLRSPNEKIKYFVKAFKDLNIPLATNYSNNFFELPEISTIISFLKVINNPLDDINIMAVMMSDIASFSPDEILKLKTYNTSSLFQAIKEDSYLNLKSYQLYDYILNLKKLSNILSLDKLLEKIYSETNFYNIVSIKNGGVKQQDHLDIFKNIAKEFSETGSNNLMEFVYYLDNIIKFKSSFIINDSEEYDNESIKIMSIHKSKGLEFPICILADSNRQFNKIDIKSAILYHPDIGIGINKFDNQKNIKYATVPKNAIKLQIEKNMLSEELRILYVALTRAKNKLMIIISDNEYEKKFFYWQNLLSSDYQITDKINNSNKISSYVLKQTKCYEDFFIISLLTHPEIKNILTDVCIPQKIDNIPKIKIVIQNLENLKNVNNFTSYNNVYNYTNDSTLNINDLNLQTLQDKKIIDNIKQRIHYIYPNKNLMNIPSKCSVSELVKNDMSNEFFKNKRPKILYKNNLSGAEKGNIIHKFMQFANYENAKQDLKSECLRLLKAEFLSQEEYENLDQQKLSQFFNSKLYEMMIKANKIHREIRFVQPIPIMLLKNFFNLNNLKDSSNNSVIIQGIADCVIENDDNIIIIDYKTDKVANLNKLFKKYQGQLIVYQQALSRIFNKKSSAIIYSFHLNKYYTMQQNQA